MKLIHLFFTIATLLVVYPTLVVAHGEDKPGPHGGFIRMPGAFHTEVIPQKNGFKVMLLDINFQHPTSRYSYAQVTVWVGKKWVKLVCKKEFNYFSCTTNERDVLLKGAWLRVKARREEGQSVVATYPLPLRFR
jgi:hypothetical protein